MAAEGHGRVMGTACYVCNGLKTVGSRTSHPEKTVKTAVET